MKHAQIGLVVVGLVAGMWAIVGCVSHPTPIADSHATIAPEPGVEEGAPLEIASEPAAQVAAPALIGSFRSRHHTIHLYAGRFSIEDSEGQVLARLVTEDEFAKLLPGLFGDFKRMYVEGQPMADNQTHGKLLDDWTYSDAPAALQRLEITSRP